VNGKINPVMMKVYSEGAGADGEGDISGVTPTNVPGGGPTIDEFMKGGGGCCDHDHDQEPTVDEID